MKMTEMEKFIVFGIIYWFILVGSLLGFSFYFIVKILKYFGVL